MFDYINHLLPYINLQPILFVQSIESRLSHQSN